MAQSDHDDTTSGSAARRVDQWLWFTRIVKSRTLAADLVVAGKVRVNSNKIEKPAYTLKIGDVVTVAAHSRVRILKVVALGSRRGPPAEAALLIEDLTPPAPPRERTFTPAPAAAREPGTGRPTKRERRNTDTFQRGEDDGD